MSFLVLYVEDTSKHRTLAKNAIDKFNLNESSRKIQIEFANNVEQFERVLSPNVDLILADVFFKAKDARTPDDVEPQIDQIIDVVEKLRKSERQENRFPIIAYTSYGPDALEYCLERKEKLYDIWDKSSASPDYMAWRISEIALEISRDRPDALLQRLIRGMEKQVPWHDQVVDMVKQYDLGWNEADQISKAGSSIIQISVGFDTNEACEPIWEAGEKWEMLSRAVSENARGHARHVMNVFWLGYFLLQHEPIKSILLDTWKVSLVKRDKESEVELTEDPLEALVNIWFYAALFHDCAQFLEKFQKVGENVDKTLLKFGNVVDKGGGDVTDTWSFSDEFDQEVNSLFSDLGDYLASVLIPHWETKKDVKPDHGIVAAATMRYVIRKFGKSKKQLLFVNEASRAMAVHNLVGDWDSEKPISWNREPIVCLLVLCDQLQSWDRERGDSKSIDEDRPDFAEFTSFEIRQSGERAIVEGAINYIAPTRLNHSPEFFDKAKRQMEKVLRNYPNKALSRLVNWPFDVDFTCWLNNTPLETPIRNTNND